MLHTELNKYANKKKLKKKISRKYDKQLNCIVKKKKIEIENVQTFKFS